MYRIEYEQFVPGSFTEVWDFFSSPENLVRITPKHMKFKIIGDVPDKIYPGLIIRYRVSPFPGYRTGWTTEITHVRDDFFVDEQRTGPYRIWHHEHHFEEKENGVVMRDIIHYKPPFGLLGKLANNLFIRKQLKGIFEYRKKKINEFFWRF